MAQYYTNRHTFTLAQCPNAGTYRHLQSSRRREQGQRKFHITGYLKAVDVARFEMRLHRRFCDN